jgi:hypothetical protein
MSEEEKNEIEEVEVDLPEQEDTDTGDAPEEESRQEAQADTSDAEQPAAQSEDELDNYSKNVQKRIKKLTEKYRQEERDREEAVRLAQTLREENEKLKSQMQNSQQAHLTEYGARLENQLDLYKKAYKDAHDRGDADALFDAQQKLSQIAIEQERYRLAKQQQEKVTVQKEEPSASASAPVPVPEQKSEQAQPAAQPDPRAEEWAAKNEWFGQDDVMTFAAFGIHKRLVEEEGFDPTSDEYYNEIDKQIRTEFPHKFASQKNGRSGQVASADTSASRKKSGRRTVKLSPSQVAIANKLGVPLEEYAKYVKD